MAPRPKQQRLPSAPNSKPATSPRRIVAIDLVRGLAMVLMVLDHARFYFGNQAASPADVATTSPGNFFTWWITHFCAPAFVLLAGLGAYLKMAGCQQRAAGGAVKAEGSRQKAEGREQNAKITWQAANAIAQRQTAWFLFTRGLLLVLLDVTLVNSSVWFTFDFANITTNVLWAIGWAMVGLAAMTWFRPGTVAVVGLAIVFLHNAFDDVQAAELGPVVGGMWVFLKQPGTLVLPLGIELRADWPVLPWFGVMCCGYALGELYRLPGRLRRSMLLGLGCNLLVMFLILRLIAGYGDPVPWASHDDALRTFLSFLNCTKYPPSLCFLLLTLGPVLLLLGWLEGEVSPRWRWLTVFGRVPLFFYLLQWPLLHGMAVVLVLLCGQPIGWLFAMPDAATGRGTGWQSEFGVSLPTVYLLWLAALCLLYPLCRWYAGIKFGGKTGKKAWWASYF